MSVLQKSILMVIGATILASVLATPLLPPPVGPFQVARPNGQNIKAAVSPVVKKMNLQVPRPPKEVQNQPLKPEQQVKKVSAPVNRLVKPQVPKQFAAPLVAPAKVAPAMPRYMPVPVHGYQQIPQLPISGSNTLPPVTGAGQNYSDTLHKNILQPRLQSNKQQGKK